MSQHIVKSVKLMAAIKLAVAVFAIGFYPLILPLLIFCFIMHFIEKRERRKGVLSKMESSGHIAMFIWIWMVVLGIGALSMSWLIFTATLTTYIVVFLVPLDLFGSRRQENCRNTPQQEEKPLIVEAEIVDD